jgi:transcriptional regulator with XRE-family HTH domain
LYQVKFGQVIRELRLKNNLTRERLAELCDFEVTTIYRIEHGKRKPLIDTIFKFANAFNMKASQLIALVED